MESVHGVDVSWMTHSSHNSQKPGKWERGAQSDTCPDAVKQYLIFSHSTNIANEHDRYADLSSRPNHSPNLSTDKASVSIQSGNGQQAKEVTTASPRPMPYRPGFTRSSSTEKVATLNGISKTPSPSPSRRNSWLSSLSSKFSSSPGAHNATTPPALNLAVPTIPETQQVPIPHGQNAPKNAG